MKTLSIALALLVAAVAANPAAEAAPEAIPEAQIEVRDIEACDASGLHERSNISKRNGWLYCGIMASKFQIHCLYEVLRYSVQNLH